MLPTCPGNASWLDRPNFGDCATFSTFSPVQQCVMMMMTVMLRPMHKQIRDMDHQCAVAVVLVVVADHHVHRRSSWRRETGLCDIRFETGSTVWHRLSLLKVWAVFFCLVVGAVGIFAFFCLSEKMISITEVSSPLLSPTQQSHRQAAMIPCELMQPSGSGHYSL